MKTNPLADVPTLADNTDIPTLDAWVTLADAGVALGWSRQYMHKIARLGRFTSLHRLGSAKPVFVISSEEVASLQQRKFERDEIEAEEDSSGS